MTEGVLSCTCGQKIRITNAASGMVRCPRCGALMATDRTQGKSKKPTSSEANKQAQSAQQSQSQKGNGCARCGRAFRGSWDAHKTKLGTLCNICVNLPEVRDVLHGPPPKDRGDAAKVSPEMAPPLGGLDTAEDTGGGAMDTGEEEAQKKEAASNGAAQDEAQQAPAEYRIPQTQIDAQRKQWLATIMGISLIAVTLFMVFAPEGVDEPAEEAAAPSQLAIPGGEALEEAELPPLLHGAAWIAALVFSFIALHVSVYLVLRFSNHFETEGFWEDQAHLFPPNLIIWLFWAILSTAVLFMPAGGVLLYGLAFLVVCGMLWKYHELRFSELAGFVILWGLLGALSIVGDRAVVDILAATGGNG